jgi:hypothetical protein
MRDHCWIVAGMLAKQKQLIRALQIAVHKTPSAPESPLSLCYVTDRERRGEWECACAQNLNARCFIPCGKINSACVLKGVMTDWNCYNHFDSPCVCWETGECACSSFSWISKNLAVQFFKLITIKKHFSWIISSDISCNRLYALQVIHIIWNF